MLGVVAGSLAFIVVALCIGLFYFMAATTCEERIRNQVLDLATLASTVVDAEEHHQLQNADLQGSPQHLQALKPLVAIHKKIPEVHYIYTMVYNGDRQFFVLDTAQNPIIAQRKDTEPSSVMSEYFPENPYEALAKTQLVDGQPYIFPEIYEDSYGRFISAVAPLMDDNGRLEGFLGVDYRVSVYENEIAQIRNMAIFALMVGAFGSILLGMLSSNQRAQSLIQVQERIRAENEMRAAKERAESALDTKQELLTIAAHDLKNPLAAIIGVADMMAIYLRDVPPRYLPEGTRNLFFKIPKYANNMLRIIEDVLKAETAERIGIQLADKPFSVTEAANEVVEFNRFASKKKKITIHYVCERAFYMIGDRDRMMEALDNLVSNAVKYSPPNSRVDVALGCDLARTMLRFSVTDEGPGLNEKDQQRLFQKFQKLSAKPTAGESSSGLGLSIVKHVVEAHGGQVFCESEKGFGATFIIEMPIVEARSLYEEYNENETPAEVPVSHLSSQRIAAFHKR
ncbi:ATP-binding protein [Cerasicoccus arenae]|uniref:histidine kinase n=1 Tax=Cerasicoccus arenae TaxID=424488 RepID=A0A8J3DF11_9BACT|nr:ATP-binding protein [Cerasicoccus arenae]MBK1857732.1 sensor histidine kinase [Cerasicoccus arenae]GHB91125.1 hypothetical protein GCM10007047_02580 [Cerasicoccus arenae]